MILVDSSIWIDHFRANNAILFAALDDGDIVGHPMVLGEIVMGSLANRGETISLHERLPQARLASHHEVVVLIERERLFGLGLGYIDAHLLAAARLTPETRLWTRDRRLNEAASRIGIAFAPH